MCRQRLLGDRRDTSLQLMISFGLRQDVHESDDWLPIGYRFGRTSGHCLQRSDQVHRPRDEVALLRRLVDLAVVKL